MKRRNAISMLLPIVISALWFPACRKLDNISSSRTLPEKLLTDVGELYPYPRVPVVHLSKDTVYTLDATFTRQPGEQLIIDEGTLIKAVPAINSSTISAAGIVIQPGGTIIANGTDANPIVMTSGMLPASQRDNWAGLTIQGRAADNSIGGSTDDNDNSGSVSFLRIEFAHLTLTGIGNRTKFNSVQVSYTGGAGAGTAPSAFEIDGGTLDARNLVSFACDGPADFYLTRGYKGHLQNILAYRHPFFGQTGATPSGALAGIFVENNPFDPAASPQTRPLISNATVIGPNNISGTPAAYSDTTLKSAALVTTSNAAFAISNSAFLGFPAAAWRLDDAQTAAGLQSGTSYVTHSLFQAINSSRVFYLPEGTVPPLTSSDFAAFMLSPGFSNETIADPAAFLFRDPFNFYAPHPEPTNLSPLLAGADFSAPDMKDIFFDPVTYRGALGADSWLTGWVNFTPLETNYNISE